MLAFLESTVWWKDKKAASNHTVWSEFWQAERGQDIGEPRGQAPFCPAWEVREQVSKAEMQGRGWLGRGNRMSRGMQWEAKSSSV